MVAIDSSLNGLSTGFYLIAISCTVLFILQKSAPNSNLIAITNGSLMCTDQIKIIPRRIFLHKSMRLLVEIIKNYE